MTWLSTFPGNEASLDLSKLEKVRHLESKIVARCPACAQDGHDRHGNHLGIFPSGKFSCAAFPRDSAHQQQIFALVGNRDRIRSKPPTLMPSLGLQKKSYQESGKRLELNSLARNSRRQIIDRNQWDPADVWESSPQRIDCPLVEFDSRHFLFSLFPPNAVVWTGEVFESGPRFESRWRTVVEWGKTSEDNVGPMVTPAIWPLGTSSRRELNILSSPYVILDFDGFDGVKPETPEEQANHIADSFAIVKWLRDVLHWRLAAIIYTGGKSLHAWFHCPGEEALGSLRDTAVAWGIDGGLIGHPGHPCRLPGQVHEKSHRRSRVLWLQAPLDEWFPLHQDS